MLLAIAPCLVALWRNSNSDATNNDKDNDKGNDESAPARGCGPVRLNLALTRAAAYCYLCGFVWGYHVHEKAVLVVSGVGAWVRAGAVSVRRSTA